jgi:hypothetical protein
MAHSTKLLNERSQRPAAYAPSTGSGLRRAEGVRIFALKSTGSSTRIRVSEKMHKPKLTFDNNGFRVEPGMTKPGTGFLPLDFAAAGSCGMTAVVGCKPRPPPCLPLKGGGINKWVGANYPCEESRHGPSCLFKVALE